MQIGVADAPPPPRAGEPPAGAPRCSLRHVRRRGGRALNVPGGGAGQGGTGPALSRGPGPGPLVLERGLGFKAGED